MKNEYNKYEFQLIEFIYLFYVSVVIITEWIYFFSKIINRELIAFFPECIAIIFCCIVIFRTRDRILININKLSLPEIVSIGIIFIFGLILSIYPDLAFDTFNYHLIAQNPRFENYFKEDFAYGNFQVWGFRLCDRLFYYFRYFLGYRLGTFLNVIIAIMSFLLIYDYLSSYKEKMLPDRKKWIDYALSCTIWAFGILFILDTLFMFGTYYVDIVSVPIGLIVTKKLIKSYGKTQTSIDIAYFAYLNGIWLAMKMTNIVYIIPIVLIYIINHIKNIRMKEWGLSIAVGLVPFLDYVLYNFICTGNPVFPYFNSFFKSCYFIEGNFKDSRWGGQNIIERVMWVVFAAFRPSYRQSELYDHVPGALIIGIFVAALIIFIYIGRKHCNAEIPKEICLLIVVAMSSSILWGITTGYSRYYILGKIIWGILAYCSYVYIFKEIDRYKKIVTFLVCLSCATITVCLGFNIWFSTINGTNWRWTALKQETIKEQIKYCGNDHDTKTNYSINADMFLVTDPMMQGVAELIDDNVYTFFWDYKYINEIEKKQVLYNEIAKYNNVYFITRRNMDNIEDSIEVLDNLGVYVEGLEQIRISSGNYVLFKVRLNNEKNNIWTSSNDELVLSNIDGGEISFITGKYYPWKNDGLECVISIYSRNDEDEKLIKTVPVEQELLTKYTVDIDDYECDEIVFRVLRADSMQETYNNEFNKVFILNAKFQ